MNVTALNAYLTLVLGGLLLLGAEIYVPGGVLGLIGGMALVGAGVVGFFAFPPPWGLISAVAIVVGTGLGLMVWLKYFPQTPMGRKLMLLRDGKDFKSSRKDGAATAGELGTARSDLRPSGIADIGGRRCDVLADGVWIEEGARIKVTAVKGNRVYVKKVGGPPADRAGA